MDLKHSSHVEITQDLVEAIRQFPTTRVIEHCGTVITVSPFAFYATCGQCGSTIKVRSFLAGNEIEDLFDSFFEWLNQPGAQLVAEQRRAVIEQDS
jgi:hypothetical protein